MQVSVVPIITRRRQRKLCGPTKLGSAQWFCT